MAKRSQPGRCSETPLEIAPLSCRASRGEHSKAHVVSEGGPGVDERRPEYG